MDEDVTVEENAVVGGNDIEKITLIGADVVIGKGKTVESGKMINEDV